MAQKDIREKILMLHADVFADCANVLAYGGERRLKAEGMQPAPTESFYQHCTAGLGQGKIHNQFCDVSFNFVEGGEIKLQFIIENETRLKRRLVLRKASYQGGAYRAQLESGKPIYPVVSMVLDWNRKGTRIPLSLHKILEQNGAQQADLKLVDDVKLFVWHMNRLPKEIRAEFTSDMGFVADYLNEGNFESRRDQKILHVEALCNMMEAITEDTRFTDMVGELLKKQEEGKEVIMCEYIDMLEARGKAIGEEIGEARGKAIGEARGKAIGEQIGENKLATLLERLYSSGRDEDAKLAVRDVNARNRMYKEFCIV